MERDGAASDLGRMEKMREEARGIASFPGHRSHPLQSAEARDANAEAVARPFGSRWSRSTPSPPAPLPKRS